MKITILVPSLEGGGAERVVSLLAGEWAGMGHEVCIVTLVSEASDAYDVSFDVKRAVIGYVQDSNSAVGGMIANGKRVRALRRLLVAAKPDVVIGMMSSSSILARLATAGTGALTIACERIYPPTMSISWWWRVLRRLLYPRTHLVIAQTHKGAQWLAEHCPGSRVAVIANPILWPLPGTGKHGPSVQQVKEGRRIILAAGRLDRQKGFDLLIGAFAKIASQFEAWDLVILGEGPDREVLEAQVSAAGLACRIRLPGFASNIRDWYQQAGLFVLSSRFEGFPNVLAEAMAHACPSVSFDCDTGPGELIKSGVNGVLVDPETGAEGLALAMEELLDDAPLRLRLGAAAQEVRERFALPLIARQWEQTLIELCRSRQKFRV